MAVVEKELIERLGVARRLRRPHAPAAAQAAANIGDELVDERRARLHNDEEQVGGTHEHVHELQVVDAVVEGAQALGRRVHVQQQRRVVQARRRGRTHHRCLWQTTTQMSRMHFTMNSFLFVFCLPFVEVVVDVDVVVVVVVGVVVVVVVVDVDVDVDVDVVVGVVVVSGI